MQSGTEKFPVTIQSLLRFPNAIQWLRKPQIPRTEKPTVKKLGKGWMQTGCKEVTDKNSERGQKEVVFSTTESLRSSRDLSIIRARPRRKRKDTARQKRGIIADSTYVRLRAVLWKRDIVILALSVSPLGSMLPPVNVPVSLVWKEKFWRESGRWSWTITVTSDPTADYRIRRLCRTTGTLRLMS